jgi:hypothetical protein
MIVRRWRSSVGNTLAQGNLEVPGGPAEHNAPPPPLRAACWLAYPMAVISSRYWLGDEPLTMAGALATESARGEQLSLSSSAEATVALGRLMGYVIIVVRAGVAGVGAIAALISMAPPATPGWVVPAVTINCGWAAAFVVVVLRRGLRPWLMVVDVLLSTAFAIAQGHLVAPGALPDGGGWVATQCSITLITSHLAWRPLAAVTAGIVIASGHVTGAGLASTPDHGVPQLVAFIVQITATTVMMMLLRRASRLADDAIARYHDAQRKAQIRQAVRAAEREQNRTLHDKVLGVLTPVGAGDIRQTSEKLRGSAAVALDVLSNFSPKSKPDKIVCLDRLLARTAAIIEPSVRVSRRFEPTPVPEHVAVAFAGAAEAALKNVVAHARTERALLTLTSSDGLVTVEVVDEGCGFDPGPVPAHRFGLSEAIRGRMSEIGGGARITSVIGVGTRVRLWWRSDG